MDIKFRLYNKLYSSFFDLVDGTSEVQQTKGLALVLAKANIVEEFVKINHIHSKIGELKFNNAIINSELISKSDEKKRADIVIRLYYDKIPVHCFIIEAKSIGKGMTSHQVSSQLDEYISRSDLFPELEAFRKSNRITGIILTKFTSVIGSKEFINLTWSNIVEFLRKNQEKSKLINDYYFFVTKIKGSMKYYEQEVYSIPTNEVTNNLANEYPFIYECPNRGRYIVKSKPLYVTFRKSGGGEMKYLFGLEDIIILNPQNDLVDFLNDDSYDKGIRERIKSYCDKVNPSNEEKQFFILSDSNKIELKEPLPKPSKNNSFRAYYSLAQILNGETL
jgi:hypothetical protein